MRNLKSVELAYSVKSLSKEEWDSVAPEFTDLSYQQGGAYTRVANRYAGARDEFLALLQDDEVIGLAGMRIKRTPLIPFGIALLNRGPLTVRNMSFSPEVFQGCLVALKRQFVVANSLMLRITPPCHQMIQPEILDLCFKNQGFIIPRHLRAYETFLLDVSRPLDVVRKELDAKWRADLAKAERSGLSITRSSDLADFDRFEPLLLGLQQTKGFSAARDVEFFRHVQREAKSYEELVVHLAWSNGQPIAGHIGTFAGDGAVYLLGASSPEGRDLRASYLLQWKVIEYAKSKGNQFYDLGGIDEIANPDVFRFKKRLNGKRVAIAGGYDCAPSKLAGSAFYMLEGLRKKGG